MFCCFVSVLLFCKFCVVFLALYDVALDANAVATVSVVFCCFVCVVLCACKCGCMWCCTGRKCCDHTAHKHWTFLLQLFPLLLLRLCPSLSSSQETQIKDLIVVFSQLCGLDPSTYQLHTTTQGDESWYYHVKHV